MAGRLVLVQKIGVLRPRRTRLWRGVLFINVMKNYKVYVLQSITHKNRYVGQTDNVEKRFLEHNQGKCRYTSGRRPCKLLKVEGYNTRQEAMKREKFLKSGQGRKFLDSLYKN
jgi:putative endonuclease